MLISTTLIAALLLSSAWLLFIAFYNSRVQGVLITRILRHLGYLQDAEIHFGSISVSIIGGKVMFRELKYITKDFALRCVDGALIFKWFTRLSPDDISRESQTWSLYHIIFQSRALLTLHGLEVHIYNRTSFYDYLEEIVKTEVDVGVIDEDSAPLEQKNEEPMNDKWLLRRLIPVLVIEVHKGKIVLGNNQTETVLAIDMDTAIAIYSTPVNTKHNMDLFMHSLKSKISKMSVKLYTSPEWQGLQEDPPMISGGGTRVLSSKEVRLHYVMDVPGKVTDLQKCITAPPDWEMTIKFMKDTSVWYGPWADRQRDCLYKFFQPPDYKVMEVSKPLQLGDLRKHNSLNIIVDFDYKAVLTILFYQGEQTSSINIDIEASSKFAFCIPWTVTPQGFTTTGYAYLYKLKVETSLEYRPLLEAETLEMHMQFIYPRVWHSPQNWNCDFTISRPVLHFLFEHVDFVTDLINDWSPVQQPDLLSFVPYEWSFDFKCKDFLILLPASQHNWVDCIERKMDKTETVFFGLTGKQLLINFTLPFTMFQPPTTEIRFDFNADHLTGSIWLPKYHTLSDSLKQYNMGPIPDWMDEGHSQDGESMFSHPSVDPSQTSEHEKHCTDERWVECWSISDLFLRFTFMSNSAVPYERPGFKQFSGPTDTKKNHLGIEVVIGPSVIRLYGVFFRHLWFFKDNYFGYDDKFCPLAVFRSTLPEGVSSKRSRRPEADCPVYDLDVSVKVEVKDILGQIPVHSVPGTTVTLPCAQMDKIVFELTKVEYEAMMKLELAPITILLGDSCKRPDKDLNLANGFIQLQGCEVDMCAMYSGIGLSNPKYPFDFLEYGFLVDAVFGPLIGKLTVPHLQQLTHWLEIFMWQLLDRENEMPPTEQQTQILKTHSSSFRQGKENSSRALREYDEYRVKAGLTKELTSDDLKYIMVRLSVARTDLFLVESGCACNIKTKSIRTAVCNAHNRNSTLGVTVVIQGCDITQFVRLPTEEERYNEVCEESEWLQAGVLSLPPIMCDINKRLANPSQYMKEQHEFLSVHDKKCQRLLFLWHPEEYPGCGCVGGVTFGATLLGDDGFYFDPVHVPPHFSTSSNITSNAPWSRGRDPHGEAAFYMNNHISPASSFSSRNSDRRKAASDALIEAGFEGIEGPRESPGGRTVKKSPSKKKKRTEEDGTATYPPWRHAKDKKSRPLSQYSTLLASRYGSIKKKLSMRKSKGYSSEVSHQSSTKLPSDHGGSVAGSERIGTYDGTSSINTEQDPGHYEEAKSVKSSNSTPSITVTTETRAKFPAIIPTISNQSLDEIDGAESIDVPSSLCKTSSRPLQQRDSILSQSSQEGFVRKDSGSSVQFVTPKRDSVLSQTSVASHGSGNYESGEEELRISTPNSPSEGSGSRPKSEHRRRSKSTLSRSSSVESFHSALSFRTTNSTAKEEEKDAYISSGPEEEEVVDLSVPFAFIQSDSSFFSQELIGVYEEHVPKYKLSEHRLSNSVVLCRSSSKVKEKDINQLPRMITSYKNRHGGSRSSSNGTQSHHAPAISPEIHQILQLVWYLLPEFEPEAKSNDNLFSSSTAESQSNPNLLELKKKWLERLAQPKPSEDKKDKKSKSSGVGKVICVAEIIDPVEFFFTPFCVHAINKYAVSSWTRPRIVNIIWTSLQNLRVAQYAGTIVSFARYVEIGELFYRELHPAAVLNLVHSSCAPTDLEIAIQHATADRARVFWNHRRPVGMRRFDNTLERSEEERLNLELFLTIPQISVRALQGGGEVQWLGTEAQIDTATEKFANIDKEDPGVRSDCSEHSDVSGEPTSTTASNDMPKQSKVAKLSLVKISASNMDISFCYNQFELQKPIAPQRNSFMDGTPPGEYTQTAFRMSLEGVQGQLHILHPASSSMSNTYIPHHKSRMSLSQKSSGDNILKHGFVSSVVFEFGAEAIAIKGAALRKNLLIIPDIPAVVKPVKKVPKKEKEETKSDIDSFAKDTASVDIELGSEATSKPSPFKYKRLLTKASVHYHSGEKESAFLDDAEEPLISEEESDNQVSRGGDFDYMDSSVSEDKWDDTDATKKPENLGDEIVKDAAKGQEHMDKSSIHGVVRELWVQLATPSAEITENQTFNPYSSLPHAVLSWSEPASLLAQFVAQFQAAKLSRYQSVIAALLAECLVEDKGYTPPNFITKFSRITVAAKALKQSPVLRILNHLRHTLTNRSMEGLQRDLQHENVPRRIVLERGIQSMLAAMEGTSLQMSDEGPLETMMAPDTPPPAEPADEPISVSTRTPVYYLGKQDYGSIAALDKISIGKPPQVVQAEAKHRTHRQALVDMLSQHDKQKLADKFYSLYDSLAIRQPALRDLTNHMMQLEVLSSSVVAVDCNSDRGDTCKYPFLQVGEIHLETSLNPAFKEFSIPRSKEKENSPGHNRRSSNMSHKSDRRDSVSSGGGSRKSSTDKPPTMKPPPRKRKRRQQEKATCSVKHVVKHIVLGAEISKVSALVDVDLLRLMKALADGMTMTHFTPMGGGFGDLSQRSDSIRQTDGSGALNPIFLKNKSLRTGSWYHMMHYIRLMFNNDKAQQDSTGKSGPPSKTDKDMLLYIEAPDIPLSVTATWVLHSAEVRGQLQGLWSVANIKNWSGTVAILQNLYVEMGNAPECDTILEPLSPNVLSSTMENIVLELAFHENSNTKHELFSVCIPQLSALYSFLPHVTRVQKVFVDIIHLTACVPRPIVELQSVIMSSISLILHEIQSFDVYFHRSQPIVAGLLLATTSKQSDISLNIVVRGTALRLNLLPSLSVTHEITKLHAKWAQGAGLKAQITIESHELNLTAKDITTNLALPQIMVKGEKVKKGDPLARSGIHGDHYSGVVEINTFRFQLTTSMLNQVLFVQSAFIKEINEFLETIGDIRKSIENTTPKYKSSARVDPEAILFAFSMTLQGIDMLATTPTGTAMSLKTEIINVEVKNKMVTEQMQGKERVKTVERPRMFITTKVTTNVILGQLADLSDEPSDLESEMTKFLHFRATVTLGNDKGIFENQISSSESFHAVISRPQLYMQPGAFDKSLLFYLSYKSAYEYWNEERRTLNNEIVAATEAIKVKLNFPKTAPAMPTTTQLKMTVQDLAVCLPVQNKNTEELISVSQVDLPNVNQSTGALCITIKNCDMKMSFGAAHANIGNFNNFIIRFVDDFDSTHWMDQIQPSLKLVQMNAITIRTGNYNLVTLTETTVKCPLNQSQLSSNVSNEDSGKMVVNVRSHIKGVELHLDTAVVSRLVALYKTLTSVVYDITGEDEEDEVDEVDADDGSIARGQWDQQQQAGKKIRAVNRAVNILKAGGQGTKNEVITLEDLRKIESESGRQRQHIDELKAQGAPAAEVEVEERKSHALEEYIMRSYRTTLIAGGTSTLERVVDQTQPSKVTEPQRVPEEREKVKDKTDTVSMFSTRSQKSVSIREGDSISTTSPNLLNIEPPSLEFEMDLNLRLDLGKIKLYPISKTNNDGDSAYGMRRDKRFTHNYYIKDQDGGGSDDTEFLIPGTHCLVHYTSTKRTEKSLQGGCPPSGASSSAGVSSGLSQVSSNSDDSSKMIKTGTLYSSITVMSLEQDQILRPCLLEYLEQLLSGGKEPSGQHGPVVSDSTMQLYYPIGEMLKGDLPRKDPDKIKPAVTPSSEHSSLTRQGSADRFPVDIVIVVTVEPSTIKLSCQPYSRHECSLLVPLSKFVLSTKGTPPINLLAAATGKTDIQITRDGTMSCLCIAGSMSECALSLYHPLGLLNQSERVSRALPEVQRRNALSITLSGGDMALNRITTPQQNASTEGVVFHPPSTTTQLAAHVSTMIDIGKLALTYDMRRMDEIAAFHTAWLNGSFIKRLLLLSRPPNPDAATSPPISPTPPLAAPQGPPPRPLKRGDSLDRIKPPKVGRQDRFYSVVDEPPELDQFHSMKRGMTTIREGEEKLLSTTAGRGTHSSSPTPSRSTGVTSHTHTTRGSSEVASMEVCETNFILSITADQVTLSTNMGSILGHTKLVIEDVKNTTSLCLKERHNEKRIVDLLLGKVLLDSKAGLITGNIGFTNLSAQFNHSISPDHPPIHEIGLMCEVFENKVDYLSNCILMMRVLKFSTKINDEWKNDNCDMEIGGSIDWDTVQVMLSASTGPNIAQIKVHLEEFIQNQKRYSQKAYDDIFANPNPNSLSTHSLDKVPPQAYELEANKLSHHWFWAIGQQSTYESMATLLTAKFFTKPLSMGGKLTLDGKTCALAIFQGEKFRDDTWALFILNSTKIMYNTLAEEQEATAEDGSRTTTTRQHFDICLGNFDALNLQTPNTNIGSVERCVRNSRMNPPDRNDDIATWLTFACTHDFAHGNPTKDRPSRSTIFGGGNIEFSTIFQLPESRLTITTDHLWDGNPGDTVRTGHCLPIPVVRCKLKSKFKSSIGIATNAGHYFFLHDLAQRYIKKMEKQSGEPEATAAGAAEIIQEVIKFRREFVCDEWELSPQLRLQGGGKVEFKVEWVLNKLGFKNPRVTIPKWIQRGAMDPLDFFVAGLVKTLVFQQAEVVNEVKGLKKI